MKGSTSRKVLIARGSAYVPHGRGRPGGWGVPGSRGGTLCRHQTAWIRKCLFTAETRTGDVRESWCVAWRGVAGRPRVKARLQRAGENLAWDARRWSVQHEGGGRGPPCREVRPLLSAGGPRLAVGKEQEGG